jgi:hypothetical protein
LQVHKSLSSLTTQRRESKWNQLTGVFFLCVASRFAQDRFKDLECGAVDLGQRRSDHRAHFSLLPMHSDLLERKNNW